RDGRVRERLADDAYTDAPDVAQCIGLEDRIAPADLGDVVRDEVTLEEAMPLPISEELANALESVRELPVRRHDVAAERLQGAHHVFAAAPQRRRGALDRIPA